MSREVKLNRLDRYLDGLDYPLDREDAAEAGADVTLVLADGTVAFPEVVSASSADRFESMDDLLTEIMGLLPRNAVGEPFQSEGDS